jgi:uncharacterized protein involved in exopolysaccharide biosynthesis
VSVSPEILRTTGEVDLRELAARLWAGRWWIALSAFIVTAVFAAVAFFSTPIYRATVVAVPASSDRGAMGGLGAALGQLGGLAALAGIELGSDTKVEEALAVLRSRELTERFIRENDLLPELFYKKWDAQTGQWKVEGRKQPTLAKGAKFFDSKVRKIDHNTKSGLITIDIEWRDPEKAAAWANAIVAKMNEEMRARAIARTNASVGYLQKELAQTEAVDTRAVINRLMEAQLNERMYANVTQEYALRIVDSAMVPEADEPVRPKKAILLALGLGFGALLGAFAVLLFGPSRSR